MTEVIEQAMIYQKANGDSHLAIDHILLALASEKTISAVFTDNNLPTDRLEMLIKQVWP